MSQFKKSGLTDILPRLLNSRVYIGISAGSMVMAPNLCNKEMQQIYKDPILDESNDGLGYVDFNMILHINSPHFPRTAELIDEVAERITTPLYALDDQSAVRILDGKVEVISEGYWKRYN